MKIDIHAHVLPERLPDMYGETGYGEWIQMDPSGPGKAVMVTRTQRFREVDANLWDADVRLRDCERAGIDVQVLSTVPVMFSYWAQPEHTLRLARFLNDHIAGMCAAHPRRFVGLGTLPMQDVALAVGELQRCMGELGFAGVEIGSHIGEMELDDERLEPFWAAAAALGAVVFVHPWDVIGKDRLDRHWSKWLVGMPGETAFAFVSLAMGGVLERHPTLKILLAHGGGALAGTIGRIDHGFRVRPDLCQLRSKTLPSELLKRVWVDSAVHDGDALRLLVDKVGVERICLGSDYPFPLGEHIPGRGIETLAGLSDAQRSRLLGGTALELLGLDPERYGPGAEAAA